MNISQQAAVDRRAERESNILGPELTRRFPIDDYIALFDYSSVYGHYGLLPAQARAVCDAIRDEYGAAALASYLRSALLRMIARHLAPETPPSYPPDVQACFSSHLLGIVAQMERHGDDFYVHSNDRFAKDFAVCRQKLVPCGAQLVDVRSGVPQRIALRQGAFGAAAFVHYMLARAGGFRPFFEMHMDPRLVLEFSAEGWRRTYVRIASLLERNAGVLGVMGVSWWFDPALGDVSPRISFLRELPRSGGARLFRAGADAHSVGNALANSKERRTAFETGRYRPMNWIMLWPRENLLDWASRQEP